MDTAVGEGQRGEEEEEEEEEEVMRWRGDDDDEEGSTGEAKRYLTWEDILQNAWKAREETMRKQREEEEARYRAEEERRAKEREEAREQARRVEERIQELFYGKPSTKSATTDRSSPSRDIPIKTPGEDRRAPTPVAEEEEGESMGESERRPPSQPSSAGGGARPKAAGIRPSYRYPPVPQEGEVVAGSGVGPTQSRSRIYPPGYSPWGSMTPPVEEERPVERQQASRPSSLEEALGWSSPWGTTTVPEEVVVEEEQGAVPLRRVEEVRGGRGSESLEVEEEQEEDLVRDRLKASYDAWSQLQNAAWADEARKEQALAELRKSLQRQQEVGWWRWWLW